MIDQALNEGTYDIEKTCMQSLAYSTDFLPNKMLWNSRNPNKIKQWCFSWNLKSTNHICFAVQTFSRIIHLNIYRTLCFRWRINWNYFVSGVRRNISKMQGNEKQWSTPEHVSMPCATLPPCMHSLPSFCVGSLKHRGEAKSCHIYTPTLPIQFCTGLFWWKSNHIWSS